MGGKGGAKRRGRTGERGGEGGGGGDRNREGGKVRGKGVGEGTREEIGDGGVRGSKERMRGGGGHLRVLIESFSGPGFLGSRGWGGAVSGGSRLDERHCGGGGRIGRQGKDGGLEEVYGIGVGAGGGHSVSKESRNAGPVGKTKLFEWGARDRGRRVSGGDRGGGGKEGSGGRKGGG